MPRPARAAEGLRVRDGQRSLETGPAGAAREQLAGFWIIETDSVDDAVRWAEQVRTTNGSIEVRGLVPESFGSGQASSS